VNAKPAKNVDPPVAGQPVKNQVTALAESAWEPQKQELAAERSSALLVKLRGALQTPGKTFAEELDDLRADWVRADAAAEAATRAQWQEHSESCSIGGRKAGSDSWPHPRRRENSAIRLRPRPLRKQLFGRFREPRQLRKGEQAQRLS